MPSFHQVVAAIDRCMLVEPTLDFVLSPDASELGTVFAEMMYYHQDDRDISAFTAKQREAYQRWNINN